MVRLSRLPSKVSCCFKSLARALIDRSRSLLSSWSCSLRSLCACSSCSLRSLCACWSWSFRSLLLIRTPNIAPTKLSADPTSAAIIAHILSFHLRLSGGLHGWHLVLLLQRD